MNNCRSYNKSVKIVWDEAKRASNLRKHGADFAAVEGFDWDTVIFLADDVLDHEVRHRTLGFIGVALYALVFTATDEELRVISLRKATRHEAENMRKSSGAKRKKVVDHDNPEWTDADFKRARFLKDAMPDLVAALKRGRPKLERPKVQVTLRLDADIVDAYRASGTGWQSRINEALSRSLKKQKKAAA